MALKRKIAGGGKGTIAATQDRDLQWLSPPMSTLPVELLQYEMLHLPQCGSR
jgi:hypothetical protein